LDTGGVQTVVGRIANDRKAGFGMGFSPSNKTTTKDPHHADFMLSLGLF
jgi:hypothetical protein